jgi:hypothetical protein
MPVLNMLRPGTIIRSSWVEAERRVETEPSLRG